jgi:hypothetical protein
MGMKLTPPPIRVSQGSAPHCWAACITSWLALNPDRPQYSLQKLVNKYGDPKLKGGITFQNPTKWFDLMRDLGIKNGNPVEIVGQLKPGAPGSQLTLVQLAQTIEERLTRFGYMLLVDNHTPTGVLRAGVSHMFVVYGIRDAGSGYEILVMDPSPKHLKIISPGDVLSHHIVIFCAEEEQRWRTFAGW